MFKKKSCSVFLHLTVSLPSAFHYINFPSCILNQLPYHISNASENISVLLLPVGPSPINPNDVGLWN